MIKQACDDIMTAFMKLCEQVGCPFALEKTEWATVRIVFLGTLLDGERWCLCIPNEKRTKALSQIRLMMSKRSATIKQIQALTGILNFLNRAMVPGRVFTRRMYSKLKTTDKLAGVLNSTIM